MHDIKDIYDKTKLHDTLNDKNDDVPITHTHVFHKEYPRLIKIELPHVEPDGEFYELLYSRESTREFSGKSIELKKIAMILNSCGISDLNRHPERRTYPSAGARFPIEIYLISFNVLNIDPGIYHYNMRKKYLEQLLVKNLKKNEQKLCSSYIENASAVLIFTTVISRSEVKYGVKAYPYSLIEVGHMCQNIQLSCKKYDVHSCPIGGFVNDYISKILDLTNNELPLYTIGLGLK